TMYNVAVADGWYGRLDLGRRNGCPGRGHNRSDLETGVFEMSRSMMIAVLVGAASLAAAPAFAQTNRALLDLQLPQEADAPPVSGVAPVTSPLKAATPSKLKVEKGALGSAAGKLELAPENK